MQTPSTSMKSSVPALILFLVAAHFGRAMLEGWLRSEGTDSDLARTLSYLSLPPLLLLLMFPYLRVWKEHLLSLLRPSALTVRLMLAAICVGIAMRIAYWAIVASCVALGLVPTDPAAVGAPVFEVLRPTAPLIVLSFLVMALVVPATEEVVNRGLILHALMERGPVVAVVGSAAIFAVMHNPQAYVMSFLAGIVLGVQALRFRTLWVPFLTHAAFNFAVIIEQNFLNIVWLPAYPDHQLAFFGLATAGVAISMIVVCLLPLRWNAAGTIK